MSCGNWKKKSVERKLQCHVWYIFWLKEADNNKWKWAKAGRRQGHSAPVYCCPLSLEPMLSSVICNLSLPNMRDQSPKHSRCGRPQPTLFGYRSSPVMLPRVQVGDACQKTRSPFQTNIFCHGCSFFSSIDIIIPCGPITKKLVIYCTKY